MKISNLIFCFTFLILFSSCDKQSNKKTIVIEKGKVGMIGFGSLISLNRTEEVFKHKYTDSIYLVHLEGYQRSWDFVTSNYDKGYTEEELKHDGYYIRDNDTLIFDNSIYLNITEQKGSTMNCVLYLVTEKEIKDMDLYEFGYERIDVSDKIKEYDFEGGKVYAYKATPEYLYDSKKIKGVTVIQQDYLDLVTKACDSIGLDFRKEYDETTSPLNLELVAPVIWKKAR
ncbi:hypothetical protein [Algibacter mikhailovii]|uniref:Uncharacterized protein n=1 Tax=Algibacter mikhailovii TaxID=425498 RepID=A0A918VAF6_9FLAO|nr:hypothetical protein [Algibacter mikhailovii]GGZ81331.1 hypothetical protein GCM10007028_18520 [Algibacter mikhailovii]